MNCDGNPAEASDNCLHCENLGEVTFDNFRSNHKNGPPKILIKNLPEGISQDGVKNLFLQIGKPISILLCARTLTAVVEFESLNEAELAIRDLHEKPPYNLKVSLKKNFKVSQPEKKDNFESWKTIPFIHVDELKNSKKKEGDSSEGSESVTDADDEPLQIASLQKEFENKKSSFFKILKYDPSMRMRQNYLDYTCRTNCVSLGRGYLKMKSDRFVGGSDPVIISSDTESSLWDNHCCRICNAYTMNVCVLCKAPYCSNECIYADMLHHSNEFSRSNEALTSGPLIPEKANTSFSSRIPVVSGCTVVITMYVSMRTVFVRRTNKFWDQNYNKLINLVAEEAMRGKNFETMPEVGELCIAKYYKDGGFYRAQINSIDNKTAEVFFVDCGNSQNTKLEDLKPLPEKYSRVSRYALKVHLIDVPEDSSPDSVEYFNKLTAEMIPLTMTYTDSIANGVELFESHTKESVNKNVAKLILPSWKKDNSVTSKLGEVFYYETLKNQIFQSGKRYDLIISHFDEKEFLEFETFRVQFVDTDEYYHVKGEMEFKIAEYCEFLKGDCYLPRENELCLVKYKGKWHRGVSLNHEGTSCCIFFVDEGCTATVQTRHIRKMIVDFLEAPYQAVLCSLSGDLKLKNNKELQHKIIDYLKSSVGQTLKAVLVEKLVNGSYHLYIDKVQELFKKFVF